MLRSLSWQVVSQGAISAPMYSLKGPSMIQSLYPTAFPLKHQQKVILLLTSFIYHLLLKFLILMWPTVSGLEACSGLSRIRFATDPDCCSCKWAIQGSQISWPQWSRFLGCHWIIEIKVTTFKNRVIKSPKIPLLFRICCTLFSLNYVRDYCSFAIS